MRTAALTARLRSDALGALRASTESGRELDVLVVGGGVTGAGIVLDAVTRGLSAAVVEAQDWSSGTSSRSSKLVHGGLRYLQIADKPAPLPMGVMWRTGNSSNLLRNFVRVAREAGALWRPVEIPGLKLAPGEGGRPFPAAA
jgi:hypothetical protein